MKIVRTLTALAILSAGMTLAIAQDQEPDPVPRVGQIGVEPPLFKKKVAPEYPQAAMEDEVSGYVILDAIMGKDGDIRDIRVLRGIADGQYDFEEAAAAALKQWTYTPATQNGQPVDVRMTLKIDFTLGFHALKVAGFETGEEQHQKQPKARIEDHNYVPPHGAKITLPVTVDIDAHGNLLTFDVDPAYLAALAYPEAVEAEVARMMDAITFKPAHGVNGPVATNMVVHFELPLQLGQ